MGINSNLNLELSGDLSPNLKLLAAVSDANLPIQPDGNTNKLQEFDQVFIQVYNDKFKLIAGDFWISKPQGFFLNYKKRGQGLTGDYSWLTKNQNQWKLKPNKKIRTKSRPNTEQNKLCNMKKQLETSVSNWVEKTFNYICFKF